MFYGTNDKSVMIHVLENPEQYGPETVKEMNRKARAELDRLWTLEARARDAAWEIVNIVEPLKGEKEAVTNKPNWRTA